MGLDDELAALRGALLDAAVGDASWDDVLTRAVCGAATSLVVREPRQGLVVEYLAGTLTPEALEAYEARFAYSGLDVLAAEAMRQPLGHLWVLDEIFPRPALERTTIFNEWMRPFAIEGMLGATSQLGDGLILGWPIQLNASRQRELTDRHAMLQAMVSDLARAVELSRRLDEGARARAVASAMLDHLDDAALALDARGRVRLRNAAAQALFDVGALVERGGVLAGWRTLAIGRPVRFGARGTLTALAFEPPPRLARWAIASLVFVSRRRPPPAREHLSTRFGLTPAEADLAYALGAGQDLDTISSLRNVEKSTTRTQLRSVMRKLGVRRQAEVVSEVLRAFPATRPPTRDSDPAD